MQSGSNFLSADQQEDIGRIVRAMRGAGMRWKQIEAELGFGRTRLWQLSRSEQKNRGIEHLSISEISRAA